MILKILKIIILLFNLQFLPVSANSNLTIEVIIDDKIITNYDIIKEGEYLKLLNPNLQNLNDDKIYPIAKNNLINETIKNKEIKKIFDLKKENPIINTIYENLFKKIGFQNEQEFKNILLKKKNYTPLQIKEKLMTEIYWNDLIFLKYKNQISINEDDLKNKINSQKNNLKTEYALSEIIFERKIDTNPEIQINNIKNSIETIGFNNTANVYSISDSSKFGGKVGWIDENSLAITILEKLKNLDVGDVTDVIQLGNSYLLIKIEDKRTIEINIDKETELKKMIQFEQNQQLSRFSIIYFNKAKMNYSINEK